MAGSYVHGYNLRDMTRFTAMIEGIRQAAIDSGLSEEQAFDKGIRDLYRTSKEDGVFCYTFFKATGEKR